MRNRTHKKQAGPAYDLLWLVGGAVLFLFFLLMMTLR